MRSRLFASLSIAALALAACGGDNDGGGGSGSKQDQVADMLIEVMDDAMSEDQMEGVEIDRDCLRDKIGELSDDDAQKILDAGPDGDPEGLSEAAENMGTTIFECIDLGSLTEGG